MITKFLVIISQCIHVTSLCCTLEKEYNVIGQLYLNKTAIILLGKYAKRKMKKKKKRRQGFYSEKEKTTNICMSDWLSCVNYDRQRRSSRESVAIPA